MKDIEAHGTHGTPNELIHDKFSIDAQETQIERDAIQWVESLSEDGGDHVLGVALREWDRLVRV